MAEQEEPEVSLPDLGPDPLFSQDMYGSFDDSDGGLKMTILDEDKGMCGVHAPVPHWTACTIRPAKFPTNCQLDPPVNLFALEKNPGDYKFSLSCTRQTFSAELNTLFIQMQTSFGVEFELRETVPESLMRVRVLVCYSDLADVAKLGPIQPCSCNNHVKSRKPEYGDHFIISTHPNARFINTEGHTILSLNLSDIEIGAGKYTGIFSYASYTSCLSKGSKVATIFSLMSGDQEVGRDFFFVHVCACPPRDMEKAVRKSQCPSQKRRKYRSASVDEMVSDSASGFNSTFTVNSTATDNYSADSDGVYIFQWKLRDRELYEHLCGMKRRYQELEEQLQNSLT